jgi:hypothetical protein
MSGDIVHDYQVIFPAAGIHVHLAAGRRGEITSLVAAALE